MGSMPEARRAGRHPRGEREREAVGRLDWRPPSPDFDSDIILLATRAGATRGRAATAEGSQRLPAPFLYATESP